MSPDAALWLASEKVTSIIDATRPRALRCNQSRRPMTICGRHASHRGYTDVVRQICRIAVFPVALVVAVASAMAAMDRGVDPVAAMFSVYLAGMVVVTALERLFSWIFSVGELQCLPVETSAPLRRGFSFVPECHHFANVIEFITASFSAGM